MASITPSTLPPLVDATPEMAAAIRSWWRSVEDCDAKHTVYRTCDDYGAKRTAYQSYTSACRWQDECWARVVAAIPIGRERRWLCCGEVWEWTKRGKDGFRLVHEAARG